MAEVTHIRTFIGHEVRRFHGVLVGYNCSLTNNHYYFLAPLVQIHRPGHARGGCPQKDNRSADDQRDHHGV